MPKPKMCMSGVYIDFIGNACSTLHCPGRCEHSLRLNEFRKREILQQTDKQKKKGLKANTLSQITKNVKAKLTVLIQMTVSHI